MKLTDDQIEIIRFIQGDLPVTPRPFEAIAKKLGISEEEVIEQIKTMKEAGVIRRFGMAVRHQNMGYRANGMSCWNIPAEKVDEAAKIMVARPEISHCYERPRFPDWPYNVYGMVHGKKKEEVEAVVKEIADAIDVHDYDILYSTIEYKRTSMSYFMEED